MGTLLVEAEAEGRGRRREEKRGEGRGGGEREGGETGVLGNENTGRIHCPPSLICRMS